MQSTREEQLRTKLFNLAKYLNTHFVIHKWPVHFWTCHSPKPRTTGAHASLLCKKEQKRRKASAEGKNRETNHITLLTVLQSVQTVRLTCRCVTFSLRGYWFLDCSGWGFAEMLYNAPTACRSPHLESHSSAWIRPWLVWNQIPLRLKALSHSPL